MSGLGERRASRAAWFAIFLYAAVMLTVSFVGLAVGDGTSSYMGDRHLLGTLILYALLPAYLVGGGLITNARTAQLARSFASNPRADNVVRTAEGVTGVALGGGLAGLVLGYTQNDHLIWGFVAGELPFAFDVVFVGGMLVWTVIGFVIAWRIHACIELWRLGRRLDVELLNLEPCRGFGTVSTANVAFVAGAVASMALQSLDAEIRWDNYEVGSYIGLGSAALLFWLPLDGLRRRIVELKARRLDEFVPVIRSIPADDVVLLETVLQHRDRIAAVATVPVDLSVASRIAASIVLPPLAWVAAALVENWVDGL